MDNTLYDKAMNNAKASVEMEGYKITTDMEELCRRVLQGEISKTECFAAFRNMRLNYGV